MHNLIPASVLQHIHEFTKDPSLKIFLARLTKSFNISSITIAHINTITTFPTVKRRFGYYTSPRNALFMFMPSIKNATRSNSTRFPNHHSIDKQPRLSALLIFQKHEDDTYKSDRERDTEMSSCLHPSVFKSFYRRT